MPQTLFLGLRRRRQMQLVAIGGNRRVAMVAMWWQRGSICHKLYFLGKPNDILVAIGGERCVEMVAMSENVVAYW
jgi:hypothetical protein